MYYVKLEMLLPDGSVSHVGTSAVRDISCASVQLESFRSVAEGLVNTGVIKSYDLKMGSIPNGGNCL